MIAAGAVLLAAPAAAPARAEQALVRVRRFSFELRSLTVLAGDSVTWSNVGTTHTVSLRDGTFDSGLLAPSRGTSHDFDVPGAHPYLCMLHPFMMGSVSVARVLLQGPSAPVLARTPVRLAGRIVAGNPGVTIEAEIGGRFAPVEIVPVGAEGGFGARLRPHRTTSYRVVSGEIVSAPVRVEVVERPRLLLRRSAGTLRVRAFPRLPDATVVLQLRLRERFGWWPVSSARLDRRGHS